MFNVIENKKKIMLVIMIFFCHNTDNDDNNIGNLNCAVPILKYSTAHYNITEILPQL